MEANCNKRRTTDFFINQTAIEVGVLNRIDRANMPVVVVCSWINFHDVFLILNLFSLATRNSTQII